MLKNEAWNSFYMGITNLTKLVQREAPAALEELSLKDLAGQTVTVDVSSYMYQYAYNAKAKGKGSHLRGFFEMIVNFKLHQITPVFIFDGKASQAKAVTLQARQQVKTQRVDQIKHSVGQIAQTLGAQVVELDSAEAEQYGPSLNLEQLLLNKTEQLSLEQVQTIMKHQEQIAKQQKNLIVITPDMYRELVQLFKLTGVPFFRAQGEADFLCVRLAREGLAAAVFSEDTDILTHGAPLLVRGINSNEFRSQGLLKGYRLATILEETKLTMTQFVDVCILAGCDYAESPRGVGALSAIKLVRKYGNIADFCQACLAGKERYKIEPSFTWSVAYYEFKGSSREHCPDSTELVWCEVNQSELSRFLLAHSNYTNKTLQRKLEVFPAVSKPAPKIALVSKPAPKIALVSKPAPKIALVPKPKPPIVAKLTKLNLKPRPAILQLKK